MNVGVILYWVSVLISAYLLYLALFRIYNKHTGERQKVPVWMVVISALFLFVPVGNLIVSNFLLLTRNTDYGVEIRSWITKEI